MWTPCSSPSLHWPRLSSSVGYWLPVTDWVLSTWEVTDPTDLQVPARLRAVDLRRDLPAAGFVDVEVQDRPDWRKAERALWEEAIATPDTGDPALQSLRAEARRSLDTWDSLRRVFAIGTAPRAT